MQKNTGARLSNSFRGSLGRLADAGIDWNAIGFRCGLEIHQQLLTSQKLFCRCPAGQYSDHYDAEVLRHMRPTLSEMGEYDGTALMEFKTRKEILYRLNRDSVCTYEMDDTPPFEINQRAVDIALQIALLCGCSLVGELHVIRKQYLDGSIPAGFQRTAIVGVDGRIPFRDRELRIRQVSVEEDACREVSDRGHTITFLTDRLSMPLVEVVTEPELYTPSEAGEAAEVIGDLMRVTGRVRRGHGATRQDVNVSVTGGTRVEIKGVPRIKMIPPLVRNEALRQRALLRIRDELRAREPRTRTSFVRPVDDLLGDLADPTLHRALAEAPAVKAVRVPGGQAVLHAPTQPGLTFADELAGRIRVIACLDHHPNLLPPPENGPLTGRAWHRIRHRVRARKEDAVVVCWGPEADVDTALQEVVDRFAEAREGIPNETRQARRRGLTDFERILPGPDRMYPDTDSPPHSIPAARIKALQADQPTPPWERARVLRDHGVPAQQLRALVLSPRYPLVERLLRDGHPGPRVAHLLANLLPGLTRRGWLPPGEAGREVVPDATLEPLLTHLREGRITRDALPRVLRALGRRDASPPDAPPTTADGLETLYRELGLTPVQRPLAQVVRDALGRAPAPRTADPAARERYAMGVVMARLRGRVTGREVRDEVARQRQEVRHVG
jgi:glutamyl-tRNA(Gln) amidotransferase subunit E